MLGEIHGVFPLMVVSGPLENFKTIKLREFMSLEESEARIPSNGESLASQKMKQNRTLHSISIRNILIQLSSTVVTVEPKDSKLLSNWHIPYSYFSDKIILSCTVLASFFNLGRNIQEPLCIQCLLKTTLVLKALG